MTAVLLDANVLIALLWNEHESHQHAQGWFERVSTHGWATCPFTQAAFVRIVSNPAVSPNATTPREALDLLSANLKHQTHQFWADEIDVVSAIAPLGGRLIGHRQVTDAYLLGLAKHRKGKLATMDRSVVELLPEKSPDRNLVVVV